MAKKLSSVKHKGQVEPVVDAQVVEEPGKKSVKDLVKPRTTATGLAKSSPIAQLNPEFEGLENSGAISQISKTPEGFRVTLAETGETFEVDEIVGVIVSGRICYTVWDANAGENGMLFKSYDKRFTENGDDFEEIIENAGVKKPTFRYEIYIQTEYSEEPLPMLGSGSLKYLLADYAKELAEQGLGLRNVLTRITIEDYYDKEKRRKYPREKLELVEVIKE